MSNLVQVPPVGFMNSRRGRILRENISAYLFLTPAAVVIFLFGIFPVSFAFFVSLHQWRRFPGDYNGLANYTKALGDFGYVLFFWMGVGLLLYALRQIYRLRFVPELNPLQALSLIPAVFNALAIFTIFNWFFVLLPVVLDIPQRIRGQDQVEGIFIQQMLESFRFPQVTEAANAMLLLIAVAVATSFLFVRYLRQNTTILIKMSIIFILLGASYLILQLTFNTIQATVEGARADGTELPIWSQIILISFGAALLATAYWLWRKAAHQLDDRKAIFMGLAALALILGGYLFVAELPRLFAQSDKDLIKGFNITVMFSFGTVPFQLAIGMVLAYFLFQDIKAKSLFRIIYFLPYITPFAATSIVFSILFANRPTSIVNRLIGIVGVEPQKWLLEPKGIVRLMFGEQVPDAFAGPGQALVVIMIYSIWTYIGYNTTVFLAGLGNIMPELYEAARIDGASRWREFRHITFPLLSPTTFFLSLIGIIGTFKAFTQIWIMRVPSSYTAVDTASIYIFETARGQVPQMGYASAMAFVLFGVILALTLVQNRIAERRVFYD